MPEIRDDGEEELRDAFQDIRADPVPIPISPRRSTNGFGMEPGRLQRLRLMTLFLIDRRACIAEMLALVGATAVPSAAVNALATNFMPTGTGGRYLGADDMSLLREMAAAMIPATDTPSARDAGVPEFIDGLMVDWAGEGARALLRAAVTGYRTLVGAPGKAPDAQRKAMIELDRRSFAASEDEQESAAYRWLKRMVFLGYRTSEAAFTSYVPNPGRYRGNLSRSEYETLVAQYSAGQA